MNPKRRGQQNVDFTSLDFLQGGQSGWPRYASDLKLQFGQVAFELKQMVGPLFQKFVRFPAQRFGDAHQTRQRQIVFGAFDAANICPMHIGPFGEGFLRQGQFPPIRAHILRHPLAILDVHHLPFWKKKAGSDIDVNSSEFNTSQRLRTLAGLARVFSKNHRKFVGLFSVAL